MRIAIIGAGVSGLVTAHLLQAEHEITLFEAGSHVGGHTHTVDVAAWGHHYAVDTGFVVFNERTYPLFVRLLDRLGVGSRPTSMSFSVRCERSGLEYCGTSLNTLFAQRRNLLRPSFYRLLTDIPRFNRLARRHLIDEPRGVSLGEFLAAGRFSRQLVEHYLVPMGAAIWSTSPSRIRDTPARFFLEFLDNHGLLSTNGHYTWRVVEGGSRAYVDALIGPFRDRIRLRTPVRRIDRHADRVEVFTDGAGAESFDQVVLATHSDQALALLTEPTPQEREILGTIPYQHNGALLHTDAALLPRARRAWASWNCHLPRRPMDSVALTYNMTHLQGLDTPEPFCVTLNRPEEVNPERVVRELSFSHPLFTPAAVDAQVRHDEISGRNRTHFCGAYWGKGFHEDGVRSALEVGRRFGAGL